MRIVCTSDLHGSYPAIPECDLLIVAGDVGPTHTGRLGDWFDSIDATYIVWIAGNHDYTIEKGYSAPKLLHTYYLCDSEIEIGDLRIYGTPYTPVYRSWAFMETEEQLATRYDRIPEGLDILITHGPPYGILDRTLKDVHAGSTALLTKLASMTKPPRYHVFGHIHEGYGSYQWPNTTFLNVAHVDVNHRPRNAPVTINLTT